MRWLPFFRKSPGSDAKKRRRSRAKTDLQQLMELAISQEREVKRLQAEIMRGIGEIPGKLKELEIRELRRRKKRAENTPTMRGLGRSVFRVQSNTSGVPLTRSQTRVLRNWFLLLCALFAAVLFVFWKAIRLPS